LIEEADEAVIKQTKARRLFKKRGEESSRGRRNPYRTGFPGRSLKVKFRRNNSDKILDQEIATPFGLAIHS
jgi:hypothetical protein